MKQSDQTFPPARPANIGSAGKLSSAIGIEDGYLWMLLSMLMSVTIFEGYDVTIFHLCTPDIAKTFHLDDRAVGTMASFVRLGGILSFFVIMISDRVGRKPIISATVLFYALFTFLTAISRGLASFTIFQSAAQIFLSAEFGVAIIMISEEFPDSSRGRGVAILHMVGLLGVVAGGLLYGRVADSRWGWRGMYFIGILPLLLVAFVRRNLRETARFESLRASRTPAQTANLKKFGSSIAHAFAPLTGPYRGRLLLVALLWNSVGLVGTPAVTFFSLYAKRDHHWTSAQIGQAIVIAYVIGAFGHLIAGWMLDRVGRKITISATYIIGAGSVYALFQSNTHGAILTAMIIMVVAFQSARSATATYSAEIFPTEIRATSFSMTVNLLGSLAGLLTPFTVGALSRSMGGLGNAVALVSIGPVIGAAIVMLFAPETRGVELEELGAVAVD